MAYVKLNLDTAHLDEYVNRDLARVMQAKPTSRDELRSLHLTKNGNLIARVAR